MDEIHHGSGRAAGVGQFSRSPTARRGTKLRATSVDWWISSTLQDGRSTGIRCSSDDGFRNQTLIGPGHRLEAGEVACMMAIDIGLRLLA